MRCLALFTGGLDSQIAVRLMQRQGIEVVGICFHSVFSHPALLSVASSAAKRLQIELKFEPHHNLLELIKRPRLGFAAEMAPCLDCRSSMVARLKTLLEPLQASFLISGEVIGQRPSSLRSRDLATIAYHGDAENLLLRPLSAKLLPPTRPEVEGWVDRNQLFDWHGRGRKEQIQLASEWGLTEPPGHRSGCMLLEPTYAARLQKLLSITTHPSPFHLMALKVGRHFWRSNRTHLVVAKNADEGSHLEVLQQNMPSSVILRPVSFRGPVALLAGKIDDLAIADAIGVVVQFSKDIVPLVSSVQLTGWNPSEILIAKAPAAGEPRRFAGFTE